MDYGILEGITRNGHGTQNVRYVAEPFLLLYVNNKEELVPIAIQLFQKPCDENPIWTPNDDRLDWLFVKMWVRAADLQIHQVKSDQCISKLVSCKDRNDCTDVKTEVNCTCYVYFQKFIIMRITCNLLFIVSAENHG